MPFTVGHFSGPVNPTNIRHLRGPLDSEDFKSGDVVECWDHIWEWDDDCVPPSVLETYVPNNSS